MNWLIIIPVGIAIVALIIFMIRRNQKDEKDLENKLNNDYPKLDDQELDPETEERVQ